ncbi:MAG: hypothetical protein ACYTG0_11705, partial [Planctomycetota bacterium]
MGWFLGRYEPVSNREPTDQADFWLRETERIVAENPASAEIAMGAALVLDTPSRGFIRRYLTLRRDMGGFVGPWLDDDAIHTAIRQFAAKTSDRCLALAAEATRRRPEDVHLWRLRALLVFPSFVFLADETPRTPDWLQVLDECARHDPDNALYDYLAAQHLWETSATIDWTSDPDTLQVEDAESFARGVARFEEGQKKRHFAVARDAEFSIVVDLLSRSRLTCTESDEVLVSRTLSHRTSYLLRALSQWPRLRAHTSVKAGEPARALALLRQSLRALDQYERSNEFASEDMFASASRASACAALQEFCHEHPHLLPEQEKGRIASQSVAARVGYRVLMTAVARLDQGGWGLGPQIPTVVGALLWDGTFPAAVLLFALGGVGWLAAGRAGRAVSVQSPRFGPLRHAIAWLVGFGAAFAIFGLAPAGLISPEAQRWIAAGAGVLVGIALLIGVIRLVSRGKFQFRLRSLFWLTLGVALL